MGQKAQVEPHGESKPPHQPLPSQESRRNWDQGSQRAASESPATQSDGDPDVSQVFNGTRSEHLQQMRKSPAVVNGRQGEQQEASSFCPLVRSCSGHQMAVALNPSQCQVLGATQLQLPLGPGVRPPRGPRCCRPMTSLPGRCPRLERCALCLLHMFTPAQEEVCGRNCFTQSHPFLVCKASKLVAGCTRD